MDEAHLVRGRGRGRAGVRAWHEGWGVARG